MLWFLPLLPLLVLTGVGGGTRRTADDRCAARRAYDRALGRVEQGGGTVKETEVLREACDIFRETREWGKGKKALSKFIARWAHRDGSSFGDLARAHTPARMTDEECQACVEELRVGYTLGNKTFLYLSLTHAAKKGDLCPHMAECRRRYAANSDLGMWRRLRAYDPNLYHGIPKSLPPMKPATLQQRVDACSFLLGQDPEYFRRVFWIDEKSIIMTPAPRSAIGHSLYPHDFYMACKPITVYNKHLKRNEQVKVSFYAMVNYHAGVCGFRLCQATTGQEKKYKVS